MTFPSWRGAPQKDEVDVLHSVLRAALNLSGATTAAELFGFLFRPPFERRMQEWMDRVEMKLAHLARRDRGIVAHLPKDETFGSVFMSASQAAARTHDGQKIAMLATAVGNSAARIDISADFQVMFVRFVDELTTAHVSLLGALYEHEQEVADVESFAALKEFFERHTSSNLSPEEFKLLCNDLEARVLVRLSEAIVDFGGLATQDSLVAESSGRGTKLLVTHLGEDFLRFVKSDLVNAAI